MDKVQLISTMGKNTCDGLRTISIYWLKKQGYLSGNYMGGTITWTDRWENKNSIGISVYAGLSEINLNYTNTSHDGIKNEMNYNAQITSTPCYLGGKRYWFICPLVRSGVPCQRRVAILYQGGKYFGCRKCLNLAYESQQQKMSKSLGFCGKYLAIMFKSEDKEAKLRTRFWKGQPTKRYARLLRLKDYGERIGDMASVELALRGKYN
jgi:hypothetical protein